MDNLYKALGYTEPIKYRKYSTTLADGGYGDVDILESGTVSGFWLPEETVYKDEGYGVAMYRERQLHITYGHDKIVPLSMRLEKGDDWYIVTEKEEYVSQNGVTICTARKDINAD